jgi:hypothetical protein
MANYQKIKILRKKDLDLYSTFKKWKQELEEEQWDDNWFVKISLVRHYPERSIPQNKYWRVLMNIFAEFTGMDPQEAHQYWLGRFAPTVVKVIEATGEEIEIRLTTSMMNTQQMTQLIDKTRLASQEEVGCYLPVPGEAVKMFNDI